jgi:4-hydroxy-tetrahydrodipicolinate reductase
VTVTGEVRVLVSGALGRMGQAVVHAVREAPDTLLVAQVDPLIEPGDGQYTSLQEALGGQPVHVAVDFTQPHVVFENARTLLRAGVHTVVGTTGLDSAQVMELQELAESGPANLLIAPNFAIGAVLMMRFAAEASRHMAKAEIVELHHDQKLDAPSGTALRTAARASCRECSRRYGPWHLARD